MIFKTKSGGDAVSINMNNVEWYEEINGRVVVHMISGQTIALDTTKERLDEYVKLYG